MEPKELPKSARYAPLARMVAFQQSAQGKKLQEEVTQEGLKMADAAAEHYRESHIFGSKRCSTVEKLRFIWERTGNWLWPTPGISVALDENHAPGAHIPAHLSSAPCLHMNLQTVCASAIFCSRSRALLCRGGEGLCGVQAAGHEALRRVDEELGEG